MVEKIYKEIKWLRVLLIIYTVLFVGYFLYFIFGDKLLLEIINFEILMIIRWIVPIIFLWYIWKKYPATHKKKMDYLLMVFFLNFIGMWLWLPSKKEINKSIEELNNET